MYVDGQRDIYPQSEVNIYTKKIYVSPEGKVNGSQVRDIKVHF